MATKYHKLAENVAFATQELKNNPNLSVNELHALGKRAGFNVSHPAVQVARKALGLKPRKRGRPLGSFKSNPKHPRRSLGRAPGKPGPGRSPAKREPGRGTGRPPGKRAAAGIDLAGNLGSIVSTIRDLEREVSSLRGTLEKIASLANGG